MTTFSALPLSPEALANLNDAGFATPTAIQAAALPVVLSGQDIIAQAATGSGKTLAFGLAIAEKVSSQISTQAVVLCPTRELAEQVADALRMALRIKANIKVLTLCGGQPMGPQIQSLKHAPQVIVATPGRFVDHLQRRRLDLRNVTQLVLDEADRMLQSGFADDLEAIFAALPKGHQTILFSATYDDATRDLCERWLPKAERVAIEAQSADIEQTFYQLGSIDRDEAVLRALSQARPASSIIFTHTKREAAALADYLNNKGLGALAIHGDLEQRERNQVIARFANGSCLYLVATDVAARGLDIPQVSMVVNYQPAQDAQTHTHRIGRTGRAGAKGQAVTLFSDQQEWMMELLANDMPGIRHKQIQGQPVQLGQLQQAAYTTLLLLSGKKQKVRKGDIVGVLTRDDSVPGDDIGDIQLNQTDAYVAIKNRSVKRAMKQFRENKIKGKKVLAKKL